MTTALLHDHTKALRKPRTCQIILEYTAPENAYTVLTAPPEEFSRIASVQSNPEKTEKWIAENKRAGYCYVVERWSVV